MIIVVKRKHVVLCGIILEKYKTWSLVMKKRAKKLNLKRETLLSMNDSEMNKAAGGGWCGSHNCTQSCPASDCGLSGCICPETR